MRGSITIPILFAAAIGGAVAQRQIGSYTTGILGNASAVTSNPAGAAYIATLPAAAFDKAAYPDGSNVKGSVQAVSVPSGEGVIFTVSFSNLPSTGGPFLYHIHDQPVPEDGNCTQTLAHLDPYQRGEAPSCDATLPETCQVGDLAGKHGKVELSGGSATFTATYVDAFASTVDGIGAFLGNRSIVFHFGNTTRITCANFAAVQGSSSGSGSGGGAAPACNGSSTAPGGAVPTPSAPGAVGTQTPGQPTATTPGSPGNSTTTSSPSTVVTAAGYANSAHAMAAVGAAGIAFLL